MKKLSQYLLILVLVLVAPMVVACNKSNPPATYSLSFECSTSVVPELEGPADVSGEYGLVNNHLYSITYDGDPYMFIYTNYDINTKVDGEAELNVRLYFSNQATELSVKLNDVDLEVPATFTPVEDNQSLCYIDYDFKLTENSTMSISGKLVAFYL